MYGALILAAGEGKRMRGTLPKVLNKLAQKSLLQHVHDQLHHAGITPIISVLSPATLEAIRHEHNEINLLHAVQHEPLGTGDAVRRGFEKLPADVSDVVIISGDTPLLSQESLQRLLQASHDLTVVSSYQNTQKPYGRLIKKQDRIEKIVEFKDATPEERAVCYINSGIYKVKRPVLEAFLPTLKNNNAAKEFYFTDIVAWCLQHDYGVGDVDAPYEDIHGINTYEELAQAEHILQQRLRAKAMDQGVCLIAPETVFFSHDTMLARGVTIHPHCIFGPGVKAEACVTFFPYCVVENSTFQQGAMVGPFAHLRGGCVVDAHAHIGNFVEVKQSSIGEKTKIKHLSYIGDAVLEPHVNVGAGTVTCNYDGKKKHPTTIQAHTFVGANNTLVAPIHLGAHTQTAAGSTLTKDVPPHTLAIGRAHQVHKDINSLRRKEISGVKNTDTV